MNRTFILSPYWDGEIEFEAQKLLSDAVLKLLPKNCLNTQSSVVPGLPKLFKAKCTP